MIRYIYVVLISLLVISGCSGYDSWVTSVTSVTDVDVVADMQESRSAVVQRMENYEVAYSDDRVIVYHMWDYRKLVACEFDDDKLSAMVIYLDKDLVTWDILLDLYESYDKLSESVGQQATFLKGDKSVYGEVKLVEKDGVEYYSVGWSYIQ